jgi:hypothetical protein
VVRDVDPADPCHACPRSKKFAILTSNPLIHNKNNQPWRCLWRGSLQITRTTRLRRTILQLRQILFTDASTFMSVPRANRE